MILTVYGGEVVLDGVLVRGVNVNLGTITEDGQYLLFLRPARPRPVAGRYEIYYGGIFEVSGNTVKPLLRGADDVFKGTVDGSLEDLLRRVESAARLR